MAEPQYKAPESILSLPVVSGSGKMEQLRQQMRAEPPAQRGLNQSNLVDRALDPSKTPAQKAIEERVIEALRTVYDPEIPVNIHDLGLIYSIQVDPASSAVRVQMTLTAPGCPVAASLVAQVQQKIEAVEGVSGAQVELVWEPPWTKERMSEAALLELGLL